MRVEFALCNIGPIGTAENLVKIAQCAEALAYNSVWTPASGANRSKSKTFTHMAIPRGITAVAR
jgi:hypothetical protein